METSHNKAIFDGMYQIRAKLFRAAERCKEMSMSESIMGYHESSAIYTEMMSEMTAVKPWIEETMRGLIEIK
jgi:hypothetical protein